MIEQLSGWAVSALVSCVMGLGHTCHTQFFLITQQ